MPLEIRELQINVTVNPQKASEAAAAPPQGQEAKDEKSDMLKQCIDDVMAILNSQKER